MRNGRKVLRSNRRSQEVKRREKPAWHGTHNHRSKEGRASMTEWERRERVKRKSERRRQRHRSKGLCVECARSAVPGKTCCSTHLATARIKSKQEYDWRIAHGICVKCGSPKEWGRTAVNCLSCADKAALKERRRRALLAGRYDVWQASEFASLERNCRNRGGREDGGETAEYLLAS